MGSKDTMRPRIASSLLHNIPHTWDPLFRKLPKKFTWNSGSTKDPSAIEITLCCRTLRALSATCANLSAQLSLTVFEIWKSEKSSVADSMASILFDRRISKMGFTAVADFTMGWPTPRVISSQHKHGGTLVMDCSITLDLCTFRLLLQLKTEITGND